jgi:hypothetical protein
MSQPGPLTSNIHQIGQTIAWSVLLNISVVAINLKHKGFSLPLHSILGWVILALTYIDILVFLIPLGFNLSVVNSGTLLYVHGIIGLCMIAFVVMQLAGGVLIRLQLGNKSANQALLDKVKKGHKLFGYFLALIYKINILISWAPTWAVVGILVLWEVIFIALMINFKWRRPQLEGVVSDPQITSTDVRKVYNTKDI